MKRPLVLAVGLAAALTSCQQQEPVSPPAMPHAAAAETAPREAARAGQYLALPGESAVSVAGSDTDAAFERQAAAYASQASGSNPAAPSSPVEPTPASPSAASPADPSPLTPDATASALLNQAPADIPDPAPVSLPTSPTPSAPASSSAPSAPSPSSAAASGLMDYTVRITNGTPGRLFIEAQDAAGTIYPCGFMHQNRSYSTPMVQSAPISGPITVVVRDPDQPGAPEIRRYKVNPPANYAGKTIDITIIPGGMYEASVDGQVYYRTPPPPGAAPAASPAPTL